MGNYQNIFINNMSKYLDENFIKCNTDNNLNDKIIINNINNIQKPPG